MKNSRSSISCFSAAVGTPVDSGMGDELGFEMSTDGDMDYDYEDE